jgi:electron transport complex protein RnfB
MVPVTGAKTGWAAWSQQQADAARERHDFRTLRLQREREENEARLAAKAQSKLQALEAETSLTEAEKIEQQRKKAIIQAAIERARLKKEQSDKKGDE